MSEEARPAKRARTDGIVVPAGICAFHHIEDWYEQHKKEFAPPVCNRLMHKGQLSIMFVGGPNTRKDFHLEEGGEFFFQMKGNMELPTVQRGSRRVVKINEGHVYCLPSRIPHSPQRPMEGSFGLVVERRREGSEMDGLIFYENFETCDKVRWERFFKCNDLGKDLPPVINAYKEWEKSGASSSVKDWPESARPTQQDHKTEVPAPICFQDFLHANSQKLSVGEVIPLFKEHPDKEFKVFVAGGPSQQLSQTSACETWLYQVKGSASVTVKAGDLTLPEGCCCIVEGGQSFDVLRSEGSVGLVLRQEPSEDVRDQA